MYIFGEIISYIKEFVQTKQFHPTTQDAYKIILTRRKADEISLTRTKRWNTNHSYGPNCNKNLSIALLYNDRIDLWLHLIFHHYNY